MNKTRRDGTKLKIHFLEVHAILETKCSIYSIHSVTEVKCLRWLKRILSQLLGVNVTIKVKKLSALKPDIDLKNAFSKMQVHEKKAAVCFNVLELMIQNAAFILKSVLNQFCFIGF